MQVHHSKIFVLFVFWFIMAPGFFAQAQTPTRPFPQHTVYTAGSIKPNHDSQAEMDSDVSRFYKLWKKHYIATTAGKQECYVFCNADGNWHGGNKAPRSLSVSEGHGYGMIITALMAGYDPEAKTMFDGMVAYFKDHPSTLNPGLMAWNQARDTTKTDRNSDDATDGDLDIAYALLLADKQWGSAGKYNYKEESKNVIAALMKTNVNREAHLMLMGDFMDPGDPFYYHCRSSDLMPDHFKDFAKATGDSTWVKISDKSYDILQFIQNHYSPLTGLFPDFIKNAATKPRPANPYFMENRRDGVYSYNACRVPWRLGCDYLLHADPKAKKLLTPINAFITKKAKNDPYKILDGYALNGQPIVGASGDNIAFIAPFGVGLMADARNQVFLNRIWDYAAKEPMSDEEYYGNTLKMLCMIVMSGNWWD